jgi:hypothetical protein
VTPDEAEQKARHIAWKLDLPAYIYWEGNAFTGGLQVYCGPYHQAPAPVLRGYDVFAVALPGKTAADNGSVFYRRVK